MKTTLTLVALALASSVVAAQTTPDTTASSRGDRTIVRTLPGYVDGSEYEQALTMFMSQKTREQVRAETIAAVRQGFDGYSYLAHMGGAH